MDEGWVVFAYITVYGFMASYGLYLVRKSRSLRRRQES